MTIGNIFCTGHSLGAVVGGSAKQFLWENFLLSVFILTANNILYDRDNTLPVATLTIPTSHLVINRMIRRPTVSVLGTPSCCGGCRC